MELGSKLPLPNIVRVHGNKTLLNGANNKELNNFEHLLLTLEDKQKAFN